MRIFEIVGSPFYIGTSKPVKGVIEAQDVVDLLDEDRERKLEERRPEGCISRQTSFLLTVDRGWPTAEHIYAVEPLDEVSRFHTGWLNKLASCDMSQDGVASHYANGYWSGKECREELEAPWEHRVGKVRVLQRAGGVPLNRMAP